MHTIGHVGEKEAIMGRPANRPTLSTQLLRVALLLGTAVLLAALAAAPASAHTEKKAGRYSFVIGFGTEPAYAGQPNSLQVIISRDGKPATDLAGQLDAYTFTLKGTLGAQKINLAVPSGPDTFSDVNDPAKTALPAVKDPTTAQLAQRLDREAARVNGTMTAAQAAQRDAEDAAGQARMLALGGLLVGAVGLVVGGLALARSRRSAAPAARPDVALTGAGKV